MVKMKGAVQPSITSHPGKRGGGVGHGGGGGPALEVVEVVRRLAVPAAIRGTGAPGPRTRLRQSGHRRKVVTRSV